MVTPHTLRVDFEGRTGLTPTFDFFKDHSDANLIQPAINEIAGTDGVYKFTIPDIDAGAFGRVDPGDGGTGASFDVGPQVLDTLAADLATIDGKVDVIDTNVDAVLVDTNEIQGKLPTGDLVDAADVKAQADQALTDYDGPTKAEMTAEHDVLEAEHVVINNNVDANEIKIDAVKIDTDAILTDTAAMQPLIDVATSTRATPTQVGTELNTRRLHELISAAAVGSPASGSHIDLIESKDGAQTYDRTVDSLEAQSDRLQLCVPEGQRVVVLTFEDDVSGDPIAGALVTVRTSPGGALVLANQLTDASGQITVNLDDGAYTQTASKLPDYLSFTPTTFTVTNIATAFTFTGTSTIPPPPPAGDPIKCNVIADSFQNVVEGMKAEASIIGEDVMTIGNNLLDETEATVKVEADSAGRFTFPLIRSTQLKQNSGVAVTYRVRIRDIGFDAKILVPDLATAFLGDIIIAN